MASTLGDLLSQELHRENFRKQSSRHSSPLSADRRSLDRSRTSASVRTRSSPASSNAKCLPLPDDGDDSISDEAALRAVVSVLSGYAGRFLKDASFRRRLRDKCATCITSARKGAAHAVLANLELGIESIERVAEDGPDSTPRDSKMRSLRNSIRLLSVVASLSSPKSSTSGGGGGCDGGYTCGLPNSHLAACGQLYLAFVYKIERNDRAAAKHLLQVFSCAPYLARKTLLPDLWELFLLPHLLHLKVWFSKEVELANGEDREQRMKSLNRAYNDQLDVGTAQFALYYKEWLNVGGKAPPAPTVTLPSRPSCFEQCSKRSASLPRRSMNRDLYQAVFGPSSAREENADRMLIDDAKLQVKSALPRQSDSKEVGCKLGNLVHSNRGVSQRNHDAIKERPVPDAATVARKSHSFRLLMCRSFPDAASVHHVQTPNKESSAVINEVQNDVPLTNLDRAIALVSDSDNLKECELAVDVIARAVLDAPGDASLVKKLSSSSIIEGLLEVTFTSKDDVVLELSLSILAELVARSEVNRQLVLNADPQLEIFLRLLGNNKVFLKAAAVLYLLKPKAKQMLSVDWIPLVLQILDYGDQLLKLFTVQCNLKSAGFYLLDQLIMGFDVDRNVENAKQLVAIGGLDVLICRIELGDAWERKSCASLLTRCIRAEGSCREYVAMNIKKKSIVQLLTGNQLESNGSALSFLTELVCLNRMTKIIKFLNELKNDGSMNTMHILLVYAQQAPVEQRPLAAALLLELDLLGDPLQYSIYREEAIDALIIALERSLHCKKLQEKCKRALMLLGGRFSSTGETKTQHWLLKRAGLSSSPSDSFRSKDIFIYEDTRPEEEENAIEEWHRKLSIVLLKSGNKRFLVALSNCIADGVPSLARSCLVTVAWMTNSLASLSSADSLQSLLNTILAPRLLKSLSYDKSQEERVLASLSLFNFVRFTDCVPKLVPLSKETICSLQDLAQVTWTAKEILFACCS